MERRRGQFETGSYGCCEAQLFEFRDDALAEPNRLRIAAINLEEAVACLRIHEPDFKIRCAESLGVILLVSGTPVD
jgi:hypothetical protein